MKSTSSNGNGAFNRGTGLLIIEARFSNPNGDPDAESDPRTLDPEGLGLISPVSFKRKLRDLVHDKMGEAWLKWAASIEWKERPKAEPSRNDVSEFADRPELAAAWVDDAEFQYGILETRFRNREEIKQMGAEDFKKAFWDARIAGNTFLESMKQKEGAEEDPSSPAKRRKRNVPAKGDHFIRTGVVQFGPGVSIAPIEIERCTTTNKAGVQEEKDRGMAPLGWRVVKHGVYAMPFFVNPMMATKSGCRARDIDLLKFVVPHAYRCTACALRAFVEIRHAWYAEHKSPLGSCPDSLIIDAMTPKKINGNPDEPSTSIDEYDIPPKLPPEIRSRLEDFTDLCDEQWE